jgi:hypothetical protein
MAQFIDCTNNQYSAENLLLNLFYSQDTLAGGYYVGLGVYLVTRITDPHSPIVCTSNEQFEELLKKSIELDCCNRPMLRVFLVTAESCPDPMRCTTNAQDALGEAVRQSFIETDVPGEYAFVIIDTAHYCSV